MNSDRLKRLRAWTEASAGVELPFVYSDCVLCLINERDVLLNAAKGVHGLLGNDNHDPQEARNALAAAIARAEGE